MERAVAWYHERLLTGADAKEARATCDRASTARRCAATASVAPDEWDAWPPLKVPDDVLRDTGLAS